MCAAAAACWWCLKVGHNRHGISGLTPLKAQDRELECEINAEAGCVHCIHCHHFLLFIVLLLFTFTPHSQDEYFSIFNILKICEAIL